MRLFIAVELPEAVRARLGAAQERLRAAQAAVKWVKPQLMHLTLRFLGEVAPSRIPDLEAAMASAAEGVPPFEARVVGLGAFPERGAPRVIWAGIRDDGSLATLNRRLEEAVRRLGFEPEQRPFSPHLTLGRVKDPRGANALRKPLDALATADFGSCTLTGLALIESRLSPAGPSYTVLCRHMLAEE